MKKLFNYMLLLSIAGFMGASCANDPDAEPKGEGQVAFEVNVSRSVAENAAAEQDQTRVAGQKELPQVPDEQAFSLSIYTLPANTLFGQYTPMTAYDQPLMTGGNYRAIFTYGTPTAEGAQAYYFADTVDFKVVARKTITVPASAALANAAMSLKTTAWFNNYYTSAQLTLSTESGYSEAYTINKAISQVPNGENPIFVKAATNLYLEGTAVKTNGVKVSFPKTKIGTTTARTWHTVNVDMSTAGKASIVIRLDDTPTQIIDEVVELNPEA